MKLYARILKLNGPTVDRRTNNYATEAGLARGIRRELKALKGAGPYLVEHYRDGNRVTVTQEL